MGWIYQYKKQLVVVQDQKPLPLINDFFPVFPTDNPYWIDRAPEALLNRSKDQVYIKKWETTIPLT